MLVIVSSVYMIVIRRPQIIVIVSLLWEEYGG